MADDKQYNILASIRASASEFNSDIKAIQRDSKELEHSLGAAKKVATEVGEVMSVIGDLTVLAMAEMTKKTAEYGAELEHMHVKSGVAVDELAKLGFAASQNGSSIEGVGTGLKFLSKNLELAEGGAKKQVKAFEALDISAKDITETHGSAAAMFELMADRISGMADPSQHAADLTAVLGKSWTELIPTLALGTAGLEAAGKTAEDLGLVMSEDVTEQSLKMAQMMKQVDSATTGLAISIGTALMPTLTQFATLVRDGIVAVSEFAKAHEGLTKTIFALGLVVGAGGALMLGLAGILLVVPQLALTFGVLSTGITVITGAVGGLSLLLPALMGQVSLIGGTLVAATAAVVGMGAAIGILIGSFVNWAIAGTRVEKALDGVMTEIMAYEKYAGQMIDTTTKASAVLKDKYGVTIDKNNKSIEEWNKQVTEALRQQAALDPKIQSTIASLGKESAARKILYEELERSLPIWQKQQDAKDADVAATKTLNDAVESLKKSFTDDQGESIFIRTLNEINRSGGLTGDVLDRIKDSLDKYKNSTNPLVQALIAQAKEEADLKYNMELRVGVMRDAEARSVEQARLQRVMNSAYADAKPLMDAFDDSQRETNRLMREFEDAANDIKRPLTDVIGLLPKLEAGAIHAGSAVSAKATEFSRAWDTAIGNVTAGISKGLTDALTGAKGWGDAMISTFKNAASGMLQAFIAGLISPLTSALGQIGGNLASVLTGGGGAGGAGGLAGIFGGLGSIFGGSGAGAAGAGAATIPSGAIVSSAAAGGAAAGISGAAIAALFNPITLFMGIRALMPDRPIQNVGPDPEHVNYAFPGHDVYGNFIGDTQEYIDAQQAVADALAAATQAALDNAAATEAEALAAEQAARLSDIETELGDVRSKLGDAMIQKMDMIDQSIEASNGNISAWTKQVVDLTDNIDSNTERLSDASYWTKRYTDLISESANELKRVSDERMSIEQRIAGLTYSTEHDRLEDIISAGDTAEGVAEAQRQLAELEAAQHHSEVQARIDELAALKVQLTDVIAQQAAAQQAYEDASAAAVVRVGEEQRQLASQIMSDIRLRRSIEDNIDTEMDHVDALNAQKDALQSMMDTLGVMRQTEIEKIDATIQGLIDRGAALETERANLALLLDVSSQTADVFERLGDAFSSAASGVGLGTVSPASEGTAAQTNMDTVELLRQIRDGLDGGGDVYMDKEAVGRVLVPVINRLVTFDRMELGT